MSEETETEDAKARSLANLRPFKPGQSGNPAGRPKSALLSSAIRSKLAQVDETDPERRTFAEVIADRAVMQARDGDVRQLVGLLKEIGDRTEGKPAQSITITNDKRARMESEIERIMQEAADLGEPCTRAEAITALSVHYPEVSQLSH
jgi:hypothetical protein